MKCLEGLSSFTPRASPFDLPEDQDMRSDDQEIIESQVVIGQEFGAAVIDRCSLVGS